MQAASPDGVPPPAGPAPLLEFGGEQALAGLRGALAFLGANTEQTNQLNVFPVPDGDTGSNMFLTLQAAVKAAGEAAAPASASAVMDAAAHGALMGARGNSGVILSQVLRGLAHGLGSHDRADAQRVAGAFREATRVADAAVMNPIEGTILTVVRDCAAAVRAAAAQSSDVRDVLDRGVREAHAAVARTTDQLPLLRDAGVVDAGGFGFAVILTGFAQAVAELRLSDLPGLVSNDDRGLPRLRVPGEPPDPASPTRPSRGAATVLERTDSWGFCTEFVVEGPDCDVLALRAVLAPQGESLLVVGDAPCVRVHVHTDAPDEVIAIASRYGTVGRVKVEDMSAQHRAIREHAGAPARAHGGVAVVAVTSGSGFRAILESLGAGRVVDGGQTMNPSTGDLLAAVRAVAADAVIVLPNNDNITLTARQVQRLADGIDVQVIATRTVPQGITALLSWDPAHAIGQAVARMQAAIAGVRTLEITHAVRESRLDGRDIHAGDVLALMDGTLAHVGCDEATVIAQMIAGLDDQPEVVTVYRGLTTTPEAAHLLVTGLELSHPAIAFELQDGGQPHYPYVLSLE